MMFTKKMSMEMGLLYIIFQLLGGLGGAFLLVGHDLPVQVRLLDRGPGRHLVERDGPEAAVAQPDAGRLQAAGQPLLEERLG